MPDWMYPVFWLLLAIVLIIVESLTFNLITIWFVIGATAAMLVAIILPGAVWLQVIVFIVVSILVLATIRDIAVKKFNAGAVKTNVSSLIGKKAIVTKLIEEFTVGEVKIDGNYWSAKSFTGEVIEPNAIVEIIEISGVKLIVKKVTKE